MSRLRAPFFARAAAVLAIALAAGCMDSASKHRVQANAFLRQGDAATALKECEAGLADKKDDLPLLILRGKILFELDRMADSKAAYERAVDVGKNEEPRSLAEAYLGLGMIASRTEDWASARKQFETLVSINQKDAYSQLNVARACLNLKDLDCAVKHGEEAGRLRGDEENVLYTLGTIYLASNKNDEAKLTFQHICDVIPAAASCPYGLALVAAKAGDKDTALKKLEEALAKKLPNPDSIAKDPGFASIRDDARFQELAAKAAPPK